MGKTLVRNGTVWNEQGFLEADILVGEDGRIESISRRNISGEPSLDPAGVADVVDASGMWVLPGGIDVHVHFREPGLTEKEDFMSGSKAAVMGGVTTVLDMPNTRPPVADGPSLADKKALLQGRSYVDYGLFGAAIAQESVDALINRVQELLDGGAIGIKVLLGPTTGNLSAPSWGELYQLFRSVDTKRPFVFHCEDRTVIEAAMPRVSSGLTGSYEELLTARPRFGELLATEGVLRLSMETGVPVHIAHVALAEAVSAIAEAKRAGAPVTAETGPQYLLLCEDDFLKLGDRMKVLPPIRSRKDQEALWQGLANGTLDIVATDHAPHERVDGSPRHVWEGNFGMAGVQTMLPLLLDRAINGYCSVEEVVRWTSLAPAKAFGLYPKKGTLSVGSDADITIVDPASTWSAKRNWWKSKSEKSAFLGWEGLGKPIFTMLRGKTIVQDGRVVGQPEGVLLPG